MSPPHNKTQREMISDIHTNMTRLTTVMLGVPGTADEGLVGDVKELKTSVNHRIKTINKRLWALIIALSGSGIAGLNLSGIIGD